jgi:hypothetical protein
MKQFFRKVGYVLMVLFLLSLCIIVGYVLISANSYHEVDAEKYDKGDIVYLDLDSTRCIVNDLYISPDSYNLLYLDSIGNIKPLHGISKDCITPDTLYQKSIKSEYDFIGGDIVYLKLDSTRCLLHNSISNGKTYNLIHKNDVGEITMIPNVSINSIYPKTQ